MEAGAFSIACRNGLNASRGVVSHSHDHAGRDTCIIGVMKFVREYMSTVLLVGLTIGMIVGAIEDATWQFAAFKFLLAEGTNVDEQTIQAVHIADDGFWTARISGGNFDTVDTPLPEETLFYVPVWERQELEARCKRGQKFGTTHSTNNFWNPVTRTLVNITPGLLWLLIIWRRKRRNRTREILTLGCAAEHRVIGTEASTKTP